MNECFPQSLRRQLDDQRSEKDALRKELHEYTVRIQELEQVGAVLDAIMHDFSMEHPGTCHFLMHIVHATPLLSRFLTLNKFLFFTACQHKLCARTCTALDDYCPQEMQRLRDGAAQCGDDAHVLQLLDEKNMHISQVCFEHSVARWFM